MLKRRGQRNDVYVDDGKYCYFLVKDCGRASPVLFIFVFHDDDKYILYLKSYGFLLEEQTLQYKYIFELFL